MVLCLNQSRSFYGQESLSRQAHSLVLQAQSCGWLAREECLPQQHSHSRPSKNLSCLQWFHKPLHVLYIDGGPSKPFDLGIVSSTLKPQQEEKVGLAKVIYGDLFHAEADPSGSVPLDLSGETDYGPCIPMLLLPI